MNTRVTDIEAREKAATVGPWELVPYRTIDGQGRAFVSAYQGTYSVAYSFGLEKRANVDAAFIAHAREDIPYLLAQLEARDKTIAAVEWMQAEHCPWCGAPKAAGHDPDCALDRILEGGK